MRFFQWLVALAIVLGLVACGGGDEVTNVTNNYPPAAETPPPAEINDAVTLVVTADPVSVNAGTGYGMVINATCLVDSLGYCTKPGMVKDITSSVGTLTSVSYEIGGNTVYVWQLTEGERFVPSGSLVFDRPMQFVLHYTTKPEATLGTVPLMLSVTTTYGTVEVVGAPLVTIAHGKVEIKEVTVTSELDADGSYRQVISHIMVCPATTTCTFTRGFTTYWRSMFGAWAADVSLSYSTGQSLNQAIQFPGNSQDWVLGDFTWGNEFNFTGELRVTLRTTLPAGEVDVIPMEMTDDRGNQLFISPIGPVAFGGGKG